MQPTDPRHGGPGRLRVQQVALALCAHIDRLIARARCPLHLEDQIRRAADTVALNIAEGAGHMSPGKKIYHYQLAHASAWECIAALDRVAQLNPHLDVRPVRNTAHTAAKMLVPLIRVWTVRRESEDGKRKTKAEERSGSETRKQ